MFRLCLFRILVLFLFGVRSTTSQIADTVEKIKTATGIHNVTVTHNETILELRNHGESRTYFSIVVPDVGFEYLIETPFRIIPNEAEAGILGFVTFASDDLLLSNQTLIFAKAIRSAITFLWHFEEHEYWRYPRIGFSSDRLPSITTPCTVFRNGSVWTLPLNVRSAPFT